jgi:hypothetical protein
MVQTGPTSPSWSGPCLRNVGGTQPTHGHFARYFPEIPDGMQWTESSEF